MAKLYPSIDGRLREFILDQPVFFVATAPSGDDGHVNLSPKGMRGTFEVLDEHRVAYLDYTGSGAETIAHLRDNGRIVVMFCAFSGPPTIVRLHGRGRAVLAGEPEFGDLVARFGAGDRHGVRSVIVVEVDRISDSCGFAVPVLEYTGDRDLLTRSLSRKDDAGLADYWATRNTTSIDGLPAVGSAVAGAGRPGAGSADGVPSIPAPTS